MTDTLAAVLAGLALGARFNPLTSALAAGACAALAVGRDAGGGPARHAGGRIGLATAVLAGGWLLGDGLRVIARAREMADGVAPLLAVGAPRSAEWTALVAWALFGLAFGYALPAWAGAYAGRNTVRGWPWAVAACVAVGAALTFAALAGGIAGV